MSLSRDEASRTLRDIDSAARRSARAYGYRHASPYLIVWGVVWLIGYGAPWVVPGWHRSAWLPMVIAATGLSFAIGYWTRPRESRNGHKFWLTFVAVYAFVWAQFATMPQIRGPQGIVYAPVLVAFLYTMIGIWTGAIRMAVLGIFVGAAALTGFFYFPKILEPWIAIVGGGGLILGGNWLRTV